MKKKTQNNRMGYSDEQHAIEMFENNIKNFNSNVEGFDILPISQAYYHENRDCFREPDGLEIRLFISILKEKKLIEEVGSLYNIVRLTENGLKSISRLK